MLKLTIYMLISTLEVYALIKFKKTIGEEDYICLIAVFGLLESVKAVFLREMIYANESLITYLPLIVLFGTVSSFLLCGVIKGTNMMLLSIKKQNFFDNKNI